MAGFLSLPIARSSARQISALDPEMHHVLRPPGFPNHRGGIHLTLLPTKCGRLPIALRLPVRVLIGKTRVGRENVVVGTGAYVRKMMHPSGRGRERLLVDVL